MLQTLFHFPVWVFDSPWIWVWAAILVGIAGFQGRKSGWQDAAMTWSLPIGLLFVFSIFVIPEISDWGIDPKDSSKTINLGLPIRGYGLMMLLGIIGGVFTAVQIGKKENFTFDHIVSLAVTIAIFGILGARIFYVIQYWDQYSDLPVSQLPVSILNMTQGGLVVFGSFFGATIAMFFWCWTKKFSFAKVADIVGPGFLVGLAFGRIGCLLNGCCFGGACEIPNLGIQFPAGSPPYQRQLDDGSLFGLHTSKVDDKKNAELDQKLFQRPTGQTWRKIDSVEKDSIGSVLGVQPGTHFFVVTRPHNSPRKIGFDKVLRHGVKFPKSLTPEPNTPVNQINSQIFLRTDDRTEPIRIPWENVPAKAGPIHPTQIYSSVNAFVLAIAMWLFYRWRRFDGQGFAVIVLCYSIARFILEWIRQDESGQLGTNLTISQWVSLGIGPIALAVIIGGFFLNWPKLPEGTVSLNPQSNDSGDPQ